MTAGFRSVVITESEVSEGPDFIDTLEAFCALFAATKNGVYVRLDDYRQSYYEDVLGISINQNKISCGLLMRAKEFAHLQEKIFRRLLDRAKYTHPHYVPFMSFVDNKYLNGKFANLFPGEFSIVKYNTCRKLEKNKHYTYCVQSCVVIIYEILDRTGVIDGYFCHLGFRDHRHKKFQDNLFELIETVRAYRNEHHRIQIIASDPSLIANVMYEKVSAISENIQINVHIKPERMMYSVVFDPAGGELLAEMHLRDMNLSSDWSETVAIIPFGVYQTLDFHCLVDQSAELFQGTITT